MATRIVLTVETRTKTATEDARKRTDFGAPTVFAFPTSGSVTAEWTVTTDPTSLTVVRFIVFHCR